MACLERQRHGRVRRFFYHHPHTVLALVLVFAVGVFAPGVASAQDATIAGTVTDTTGGILPGVTVEAQGRGGERAGGRHRRDRPVHVQADLSRGRTP